MAMAVVLLVVVALWLYALIDCITTDAGQCRNLPKPFWVVIVVFVPTLGSLLWLLLGRPEGAGSGGRGTARSPVRRSPAPDDHPRDSATAQISDRRSAELDREIEAWEARQRAQEERDDE
jgi:hypothetical protein